MDKKTLMGAAAGAAVAVVVGAVFLLTQSGISAKEMRLEKYQGQVSLENSGIAKAVVQGARLEHGDSLETQTESYGYLLLDESKVLQVDEVSHIGIAQVDAHLDITVHTGSVFFNVTSPLTEAESLEFHTNNVVTGVRGTSGIVSYDPDKAESLILVLTGTVAIKTIESVEESATVSEGELAIATTMPDGSVVLVIMQQEEYETYYNHTFIDGVQSYLSNESGSYPLSEALRPPEFITLSEHILIHGDVREMPYSQALAFAEIIKNSQPAYEEVQFFDGGNGNLVMVGRYFERDVHHFEDYTATIDYARVSTWNGTTAQELISPQNTILSKIYQRESDFLVEYHWDNRLYRGAYIDFAQLGYVMENGQLSLQPEYFFMRDSSGTLVLRYVDILDTITDKIELRKLIPLDEFYTFASENLENGLFNGSNILLVTENGVSVSDYSGLDSLGLSYQTSPIYPATTSDPWTEASVVLDALLP